MTANGSNSGGEGKKRPPGYFLNIITVLVLTLAATSGSLLEDLHSGFFVFFWLQNNNSYGVDDETYNKLHTGERC